MHTPIPALAIVGLAAAAAAAGAAPQSADPALRLVRSLSGTRGAQRAGSFEVDDPRTTFTLPQDRQVLVYFEWEGLAPGLHRFEGRWKDPTGSVVLVAPAEQKSSGRRFGIYWTLALPETAAPGLWVIEASVDGRPAGTHAFEIRGGRAAAAGLTAAQLYERARGAAALVERLGPAGEVAGLGVATALDGDLLVVPFQMVDGASTLRVALPDGRRLETREVGAFNRRQGWALVRVPSHGVVRLPRAKVQSVGEALALLDVREDGSRVIGSTSVVGESSPSGARGFLLGDGVAAGAPALNAAGEQVGIVSSSGDPSLGEASARFFGQPVLARGTLLLDLEGPAAAAATAPLSTLERLAAQGHFMRPLSPESRHVISGVFAGKVQRGGAVPMPLDQRTSFGRREGQVFVFVQWNPQDKRNSTSTYEIYDADNKLVTRSEAVPLKLKPKELLFSTWGFAVERLPAAAYRVDLLLGGEPVWRGWVRITD